MNRTITLSSLLVLMLAGFLSWGQGHSQANRYRLSGTQPITINVNKSFTATTEITPFPNHVNSITGLAVSAVITLDNEETSEVRIILVDKNYEEYLVYEAHSLLESGSFTVDQLCEETCILENVRVGSLRIEVTDATVELQSLTCTRSIGQGVDIEKEKRDKKLAQNDDKINRINQRLKEKGRSWIAGPTEVGEMTYAEKKSLFGQSTFPAGFEFYAGGVITTGDDTESIGLKSATASQYVDDWDWRNRHGRNWISPVANQSSCGSCWAFAAAGATEAMVNLFFNQLLNLNLSEQELLSCTSGTCSGGYPGTALNYITSSGVVDETTFPYVNSDVSCENKGTNPAELIKIEGKVDFGSGIWSKTEDNLKKMLIQMGPVSGGLTDWSHAMALVGYKVVKEGDKFYYRDLNKSRYWKTVLAGDPLIGKTVWIFKNSWGSSFGDQGYVYVETAITNMNWTHAIKPGITSLVKPYQVICEDKDGDGYYWWGLGPKPAGYNIPDTPDGDDSDPTRGPVDAYGYYILLSLPPAADFSADKTTIVEGETVQFIDLSSQITTSWSWVFEGGNPATSTAQNPIVSYAVPGSYKVALTASNVYGSNTKTVSGYITADKFVPVYCTSKGNGSSDWINYASIGGKTISSGSSGTAGYSDFTTLTKLNGTAGSSFGFTLTPGFKTTASAQVWRIWIDFNQDLDFDDPGELIFTSDLTSVVVSGSVKLPVVPGVTTRLRVSMKRGGTPATCEIFSNGEVEDYTIAIAPAVTNLPVADFVAAKTKVLVNENVQLYDKSTGTVTSHAWVLTGGTPSNSNLKDPVVSYSKAGTYTVSLTAANEYGSDTKTVDGFIVVEAPVMPVADFTASKTVVKEGESVSFTDLSTGGITAWNWTFDGGNPATSTLQNPVVKYPVAGKYKVSLTSANANGTSTKTVDGYITVEAVIMPVADFTAGKTVVKEGESVSFTDLSTGGITAWSWTFDGGNPATSTLQNPVVKYPVAGKYKVSLTSANANGSSTKTVDGYITVEAVVLPVADFTADLTKIKEGETVQFTDLSTSNTLTWSWTFEGGNPSTSTLKNPAVKYAQAGSYRVSLTANGNDGSHTKAVDNYITVEAVVVEPLVAGFTSTGTTVEVGGQVQFYDTSTGSPTGWQWSFPGGTPSSSMEQNPVVTYPVAGNYDVSLIISKEEPASVELVKLEYINVTELPAPLYCTPVSLNSNQEYISQVTVGNELSVTSAGSGYTLHENIVNLIPGKRYSVTLVPGPASTKSFWRIWIDFNGDGDFSDSGETLIVQNNKKGTVSTSILIPSYASGITRMRISMRSGNSPGPCDDNFSGEVEDYLVSFAAASSSEIFTSAETLDEVLGFTCYPNPVSDALQLRLKNLEEGAAYNLYNLNGSTVTSGLLRSTETVIDMTCFPQGMYILKVVSGHATFSEKIIKK